MLNVLGLNAQRLHNKQQTIQKGLGTNRATKQMKVNLNNVMKLVSTFRKNGSKVEESIKVKAVQPNKLEESLARKMLENDKPDVFSEPKAVKSPDMANTYERIERMTAKSIEIMPSPVVSSDPKVQAIYDADHKDMLKREQAVAEYAKLPAKAKNLLNGRKITLEAVRTAARFNALRERAAFLGNETIPIHDWDDLDKVEQKITSMEQWAKDAANKKTQLQMNTNIADTAYGVSDVPPVHIVDGGYYLLLEYGRVFAQTDDPDDKWPVMLAKLNGVSRGSDITLSGGTYEYLGESDYKMLLETRPPYESVRKAYQGIRQDRIRMDFNIAKPLFG